MLAGQGALHMESREIRYEERQKRRRIRLAYGTILGGDSRRTGASPTRLGSFRMKEERRDVRPTAAKEGRKTTSAIKRRRRTHPHIQSTAGTCKKRERKSESLLGLLIEHRKKKLDASMTGRGEETDSSQEKGGGRKGRYQRQA